MIPLISMKLLHSLGCSNESFRCSLILCRSWIHSLILDGTIYIYISFDVRRFFIVYAILCMRVCVCNSSKSRMILVELTFPMYFGWASHTSLVFCWEPNGSTDFVWSLRFPMDLRWNLSLPLDVLHGASLFGFRWNLTY